LLTWRLAADVCVSMSYCSDLIDMHGVHAFVMMVELVFCSSASCKTFSDECILLHSSNTFSDECIVLHCSKTFSDECIVLHSSNTFSNECIVLHRSV